MVRSVSASENPLSHSAMNGFSLTSWAVPPSSSSAEHIAGGGDQIRGDRVPGPRVRQEPAAARGKNGEPLPSAVREVFPDGFRYEFSR